jgi:site-specific recombinase XerD
MAIGAITLVKLDLPYLWGAVGRHGRQYWFYRRNGRRIPITSPEGRRLRQGDAGFFEAYERIHATFGTDPRITPRSGTLAHLIDVYREAPEFRNRAPKTRRDYGRYLDLLKAQHGHRSVAAMPREAVFKIRDEHQATPRTANYIIAVLRLILSYAEDRKLTFRLPTYWTNPARRPKKLDTGEGHRPWEEAEIDAYRKQWGVKTLERVLFEAFLNSGQRGGDLAPMIRQQYFRGEIAVAQEKTKERVWIPASRDLRAALNPWLDRHAHVVLFPTSTGRPLKVDHMRHLMREAIRAAGLPDDCTLHGLRYTFATRGIELGLDWQTIESIVGHKTAEMAFKYTEKRRRARLAIATFDAARGTNRSQD